MDKTRPQHPILYWQGNWNNYDQREDYVYQQGSWNMIENPRLRMFRPHTMDKTRPQHPILYWQGNWNNYDHREDYVYQQGNRHKFRLQQMIYPLGSLHNHLNGPNWQEMI